MTRSVNFFICILILCVPCDDWFVYGEFSTMFDLHGRIKLFHFVYLTYDLCICQVCVIIKISLWLMLVLLHNTGWITSCQKFPHYFNPKLLHKKHVFNPIRFYHAQKNYWHFCNSCALCSHIKPLIAIWCSTFHFGVICTKTTAITLFATLFRWERGLQSMTRKTTQKNDVKHKNSNQSPRLR